MPFWNPDHPEQDQPELRAQTWQQAAELASVEPEQAAALLMVYEAAHSASSADASAFAIEIARADALAALAALAAFGYLRPPVALYHRTPAPA